MEGMDKNTLPFKISIASPCPARWEDMGGSDRVRFCDHCRKNVYNLSAMTSAEATQLLQTPGQLCARIYQRADGTVLTADCPVGIARQWRRVKTMVAAGVAVVLLAFVNLVAFARGDSANDPNNRCKRNQKTPMNQTPLTGKVSARPINIPPPGVTMGMIGMPIPRTNATVQPTLSPVKK
jgi:hypothetical protein